MHLVAHPLTVSSCFMNSKYHCTSSVAPILIWSTFREEYACVKALSNYPYLLAYLVTIFSECKGKYLKVIYFLRIALGWEIDRV